MVVNQIDVVVVGPSPFENRNNNAVTVGCGATSRDVPCQIRIDVVVRVVNVMPLRTELRVVGRRPVFHIVVELSRFHICQFIQCTQHFCLIRHGFVETQKVD